VTVRPFVAWPDRRLRTPAAPVEAVDDGVRAIWQDMIDTMVAMPGVGLAAPQIGVMLRLAVVDETGTGHAAFRLANPEIVASAAELSRHEEASPNLPGVSAMLERPEWVEVVYLDESGTRRRRRFSGLASTSVQHQIDHLDGRMYFDRLGRVKRQMLIERARKLARRG